MVIKLESDRDTQNSLTIITRIPFHMYISACSIIFRSCYIIICTSYVYIYIYTGKYDQTDMYLSDPSCIQNFKDVEWES